MVIEIKPLHYGHYDGHTDICYSEDGEKLISCGGDGDVRIWNYFGDDDPLQTCLGEFALSVRHKADHILVGTDNNNVQLLSFSSGERDGILTRFTAHVNHIVVGKEHNWAALASEDMTVKLMELSTKETKSFTDLKGPALSVALCSKVKHMAVSCGDGRLIIYNVEDQSVAKEINVVPKANSFKNAKLLCRTDFDQKHDKYFAYPDKNKVVILNTSDWSESYTLSTDIVERSYSIVAFSPCSNYIAAVTLEGDIVIWGMRSQSILGYKTHPKEVAITSIAWSPKENGDLAFGDIQGYVGLAVNCTNAETSEPVEPIEESNDDFMDTEAELDFDDGNLHDDNDDDEDNENAVSLEKLKSDIMGPLKPDDDKASTRSPSPRPRSRTPELPLQAPFMPSSTPEHLDPRYMCWNEVAVVRSYGSSLDADDEGTRSIEVEFHDSSLHNSMMKSNFHGYTMASVSTTAFAVANVGTINVVPLGSSSKDWHLKVDEPDEIVCIATSQNLICFATTNNLVHVCSIYGTQKCVLSVPGPVLSMSAFGHVLMVAYHAASIRKGDQCVEIMLIKLEGATVENRSIKSALSPGSKLQWLGFSDLGTPAMMDSSGMVYLHPLQCGLWLPFLDTTKNRISPLDGFFVTAIYETFGTVRGIRCKGTMYPGFTPRPTVTEVELKPPFAELHTEKSQLESNLFTWSTLQIENTDKKYKECALKTFALAAKNNLDQRALEFVDMLGNGQVLNLAVKYATKLDKRRLAEKLTELAAKLQNDNEDDDDNDLTFSTPSNVIKPSKQILLSTASKIMAKNKRLNATPTQINSSGQSMIDSQESTPTLSKTALNTQDTTILEDEPKNPFLKSLKKPKTTTYNPLSLTDKFAGFDEASSSKEKENQNGNDGAEKRKKPDTSPMEKSKEKQRKLDRFMFSKRT